MVHKCTCADAHIQIYTQIQCTYNPMQKQYHHGTDAKTTNKKATNEDRTQRVNIKKMNQRLQLQKKPKQYLLNEAANSHIISDYSVQKYQNKCNKTQKERKERKYR
eukprot:58883_1